MARQGVAFLFSALLVPHSGLLGLSELQAELLANSGVSCAGGNFHDSLSFDLSGAELVTHSGLLGLAEVNAELLAHLGLSTVDL